MKRLLVLILLTVLLATVLLTVHTSGLNRSREQSLKPGSIITADEIERLEEEGVEAG